MQTTEKDAVSTLNNLIEVCKDGQKGFQAAAEALKDPALKADCLRYSLQRAEFAGELSNEVRHLAAAPEKTGSVAAAIHRGWLDLRAAISTNTDEAIIKECERGEDCAKESYEKALEKTLPANVSTIVRRQYADVKEVHDRFSALQKAAR